MPTQEEIDEAIEWATSEIIYNAFEADRARLIHYLETLTAAYRVEKARAFEWQRAAHASAKRAELAKQHRDEWRAFSEFRSWGKSAKAYRSMVARHESERKEAGI